MKTIVKKYLRFMSIAILTTILLTGCSTFMQPNELKNNCATSTLLNTDLTQSNSSTKAMLPSGETCPNNEV